MNQDSVFGRIPTHMNPESDPITTDSEIQEALHSLERGDALRVEDTFEQIHDNTIFSVEHRADQLTFGDPTANSRSFVITLDPPRLNKVNDDGSLSPRSKIVKLWILNNDE